MKMTYEEMNEMKNAVQDRWFEEWHKTGKEPAWDAHDEMDRIYNEWYLSMEVGDHIRIKRYTDVEPATIIKKTATTITVRHDKATRKEDWKPEWIVGGFSAICLNNEDQQDAWIIEEDPDGYTEVFRYRKSWGLYMNKSNNKIFPGWKKFYDYNF